MSLYGNLPIQYVYLTFDDGPLNGTKKCLEVCNELNVKSTFFLVGLHIGNDNNFKIVKSLEDNFPEILVANHSYCHANERYQEFYGNTEDALKDFCKMQEKVSFPFRIVRLPGYNTRIVKGHLKCSQIVKPISHILLQEGFRLIGWDLEWNYNTKRQKPKKLVNQILYCLRSNDVEIPNHLILLMHDWMFQKEEEIIALKEVISLLKEHSNIKFETVNKYPN